MKKAFINIVVILITAVIIGYLVFTGLEVKKNDVENALSNAESRYEKADM